MTCDIHMFKSIHMGVCLSYICFSKICKLIISLSILSIMHIEPQSSYHVRPSNNFLLILSPKGVQYVLLEPRLATTYQNEFICVIITICDAVQQVARI